MDIVPTFTALRFAQVPVDVDDVDCPDEWPLAEAYYIAPAPGRRFEVRHLVILPKDRVDEVEHTFDSLAEAIVLFDFCTHVED